jgi:hypothetical protein
MSSLHIMPSVAPAIILLPNIVYLAGLLIYRLYFHPIASFPGPKLAAATKWYEFYFDVIKSPGGQFSKHVEELHKKYGPIVRINPDELHITDSDFYDVLHSGKRDKWPPAAQMVGLEVSTFAAVEHSVHRQRAAANAPLIARKVVVENMSMIREQLMKLRRAFESAANNGIAIELGVTFLAFTTDVAGQYFFGESLGLQDDMDKASAWKHATHSVARGTPVIKQFPGILKLALKIPLAVWKKLDPVTSALLQTQHDMGVKAQTFLRSMENVSEAEKRNQDTRPPTLFHSIYRNPGPDADRLLDRLTHEGINVIVAGGETTAKVSSAVLFSNSANCYRRNLGTD